MRCTIPEESQRGIAASIGLKLMFSNDTIKDLATNLEGHIYIYNKLINRKSVLIFKQPNKEMIVDDCCFDTMEEIKERLPKFKLKVIAEKI